MENVMNDNDHSVESIAWSSLRGSVNLSMRFLE